MSGMDWSTQEFCMSVKIRNEKNNGISENDCNMDSILPDYLSDIKKILRVGAKARLTGKYPTAGKIEYEGIVTYTVLFFTEDGHLRTAVFTAEFNNTTELPDLPENCSIRVEPEVDMVGARLLNPRKMNLKSKIKTKVEVSCKRCLAPKITGKTTIEDEINLERLIKEITLLKSLFHEENDLTVSEDFEIESSMPPIQEILSCDSCIHVTETKTMAGKALFKGDLLLTVFYLAETPPITDPAVAPAEQYCSFLKKIPISQIVAIDDAMDGQDCKARGVVSICKTEVQTNSYGENRTIAVDVSYDVLMECMQNEPLSITSDLYSTEYECQTQYSDLMTSKLFRHFATNFSVNESVVRNDCNAKDATAILDMDGYAKIDTVRKEKGKFILEGNAFLSAILVSTNPGEWLQSEFQVPIKCELDGTGSSDTFTYECDCKIINIRGRLDTTSLYTDFEVAVDCVFYDQKKESILETAVLVKEKRLNQDPFPPVTLYYPHFGETLWDIGKQYKMPCATILRANKLADSNLSNCKVLLIPHSPKKPVYSKII